MLTGILKELNAVPVVMESTMGESEPKRDERESNRHFSIRTALFESIFTNRQSEIARIFRGEFPYTSKPSQLLLDKKLWHYVIAFHNPDFCQIKNRPIMSEFANNFYKNAFRKKKEKDPHIANIRYMQERRAFMHVFAELDDFGNGKSFINGGKVKVNKNKIYDNGSITKDFMTLIRNALMYKLVGNLRLKVKQMVSSTGKYIFFLVSANENELKNKAEKSRYIKHLEISQVDIISLMPCDEALRPYHVLSPPNVTISKTFRKLKKFYQEVLKYDKQSEVLTFNYEPSGVSDLQWQAYSDFLSIVKSGVKLIKKSSSPQPTKVTMFSKLIKNSLKKVNTNLPIKHRLKNLWDHLNIRKDIAPYFEYKNFTNQTNKQNIWRLYKVDEDGSRDLFRNMDKIRLVSRLIDNIIDLDLLENEGLVAAHFPLHNEWELNGKKVVRNEEENCQDSQIENFLFNLKSAHCKDPLFKQWKVSLFNQNLPLSKLRNYYGEKVTIYFEFLRMFHKYLLVPSIFGIVVFTLQHVYELEDNILVKVINVTYSLLITVWSTVFNKYWKQKESGLAIMWGNTNFEYAKTIRGRFTGTYRRSPISDDLDEIHYPDSKRLKFFILSATATFSFICLVLSFVASFIILKTVYDSLYLYFLASLGNAIQIQFFNFIYSKIAGKLTEYENHETREKHEDSLIFKTFVFQFVNSFNSFFYIGFIKPYTIGCGITGNGREESCMVELFIQLFMIFIVGYLKNIIELGIPFIRYHFRKHSSIRSLKDINELGIKEDFRSELECEINKDYYLNSNKNGTISDYLELAILFAMLNLFAIAFPLSTVLTYFGLWIEMYTDKFKIMYLVRRPVPMKAKCIGSWSVIFNLISVFSIFTNAGLFCFTASTFNNADSNIKFLIYGSVVITLLIFRSLLQVWIPDILPKYEIVSARHHHIISRLLEEDSIEKQEEEPETYDGTLYFSKNRYS